MKEKLILIIFILFIAGIIPMGLMILAETHKIIFALIMSPVLLSFGKEIIGDVLEQMED